MVSMEYTFYALLKTAAEKFGEREVFRFTDAQKQERSVSYRRLREETEALSLRLSSPGCRHRQIALFGENSYEWLLAFFAITVSGNTAVPTDKGLSAADALHLFRKTDCAAVICSDTYEDMAQAFEAEGFPVIRMHELPRLIAEGGALTADSGNEPQPEDPAAIYFTSGTSGDMKAAVLSHRNLIGEAVNAQILTGEIYKADYNGVLVLPLHHAFSMVDVLEHIVRGNFIYITHNLRNLPKILRNVQPQVLLSVPMLMENLLLQAQRCGAGREAFGGNLRIVFCGGAPVSAELVSKYQELGIELLPGYGITECSPLVSLCIDTDRPAQCTGIVLPCDEVKIAEDGEILVRGDSVFSGYYNDPAATSAAFRDGWFLTGDLGYLDGKGRLYVTGRKKNLIILSNGENVAAEELEVKLYAIPCVKEVVAYGESNTIVAEAYLDPSLEDAETCFRRDVEALNRTLPAYKNIGKILVRSTEFPKTTTMKIKRDRG